MGCFDPAPRPGFIGDCTRLSSRGYGGKGQMFASAAVRAGIHTVRARLETRVLVCSGVTSGDKGGDHDQEAGLDVHLGRRKVEVEAVSLIW